MKNRRFKTGFTLVEMLVAIGIIAVLASIVIRIASRIGSQAKEQLTENTLAIINTALGQFRNYGYNFEYTDSDYTGLKFPPDCNGLEQSDLEEELEDALGLGPDSVDIVGDGVHDANNSGSEALYFFLSRVPECRQSIEKIDASLITDRDPNNQPMSITIDFGGEERAYQLLRFIDPWGKSLRYSHYENDYEDSNEPDIDERRNFPLVISAGQDGVFGTEDDITNR